MSWPLALMLLAMNLPVGSKLRAQGRLRLVAHTSPAQPAGHWHSPNSWLQLPTPLQPPPQETLWRGPLTGQALLRCECAYPAHAGGRQPQALAGCWPASEAGRRAVGAAAVPAAGALAVTWAWKLVHHSPLAAPQCLVTVALSSAGLGLTSSSFGSPACIRASACMAAALCCAANAISS
jgi:hypothetical protein